MAICSICNKQLQNPTTCIVYCTVWYSYTCSGSVPKSRALCTLVLSFIYWHAERQKIDPMLIYALEWHFEKFSPMQGNYASVMFYANALREWVWLCAHMNVMTFSKFAPTCYGWTLSSWRVASVMVELLLAVIRQKSYTLGKSYMLWKCAYCLWCWFLHNSESTLAKSSWIVIYNRSGKKKMTFPFCSIISKWK